MIRYFSGVAEGQAVLEAIRKGISYGGTGSKVASPTYIRVEKPKDFDAEVARARAKVAAGSSLFPLVALAGGGALVWWYLKRKKR